MAFFSKFKFYNERGDTVEPFMKAEGPSSVSTTKDTGQASVFLKIEPLYVDNTQNACYSDKKGYEINTEKTCSLPNYDVVEMTDEEFLVWLFGDVDFDSFSVSIFE